MITGIGLHPTASRTQRQTPRTSIQAGREAFSTSVEVPPAGFDPAHTAPEADALLCVCAGRCTDRLGLGVRHAAHTPWALCKRRLRSDTVDMIYAAGRREHDGGVHC